METIGWAILGTVVLMTGLKYIIDRI